MPRSCEHINELSGFLGRYSSDGLTDNQLRKASSQCTNAITVQVHSGFKITSVELRPSATRAHYSRSVTRLQWRCWLPTLRCSGEISKRRTWSKAVNYLRTTWHKWPLRRLHKLHYLQAWTRATQSASHNWIKYAEHLLRNEICATYNKRCIQPTENLTENCLYRKIALFLRTEENQNKCTYKQKLFIAEKQKKN
jgi:hypothetical protein